jgi:hypothetical protein
MSRMRLAVLLERIVRGVVVDVRACTYREAFADQLYSLGYFVLLYSIKCLSAKLIFMTMMMITRMTRRGASSNHCFRTGWLLERPSDAKDGTFL